MKLTAVSTIEFSGRDGYECYRIPGIVATESGTLIAYYEARHGKSDWAVIDLLMKKSVDGGQTWSRHKMLFSGMNKNAANNPVMIADGGRLHFLCLENYKRLFYMFSDDEGETWSEIREITSVLDSARDVWQWTCAAVGPGHGMRLSNGRLIASCWLASDKGNVYSHTPSKITTIYSDNRGETWHLGEVFEPENTISPNEAALAQNANGSVIMSVRTNRRQSENPFSEHYRCLVESADGIGGWHTVKNAQRLPDPICDGGMCNTDDGILFTNCASYFSRTYLTLRKSTDFGISWQDELMYEPIGGYSDCAYNAKNGRAYVFYEYNMNSELRVGTIEI